ncbi:alpha/beta fold hydrolase [Caulobacter sp. NIBR2454]|uniref:alpha/beta fold hydrolase n=1 Tax=Caulobacter sp. NIBR2454 TaxID=3015996 RepID=UPI0022B71173|nr:alpha/beta hydrolase [Caulobacter sp. NIBR2454]
MRFSSTPVRAIAAACLLLSAAPALAEPSFVEVDGGKLAYEACGSGPRTIVLIHDGILHSAAYEDVQPLLCERFRVVRYDRRGYGASPPTEAKTYNPAKDLEQLLKALNIERATLVGSSAGGGVAVDFALAHPEAVDRLVLVGPWVAGFKPSLAFMTRGLKLQALFRAGDIEGAARDPYILTKDADGARERVVAWIKANPHNFGAGNKERFMVDGKARLGEVKAPTLILVGEVDIENVHEQALEIEALLPGALHEVVPATGHFMYVEQPKAFADRVAAFASSEP